jgi:8-oxo-dGTP pyrophosphatase MutT (NUDIX family)
MIRGSLDLTADQLRQKLAATSMPADPLDVDFTHMGTRMPESMVERLKPDLRPAGVLIPVVDRPGTPSVLLTERSQDLRHHAGQVSFPGGGMETGDRDIVATALRETHEEIGIEPHLVDVAGFLEPIATITGYAVTCVVGIVAPSTAWQPDPLEVDEIFEVPLAFLLDERNMVLAEREYEGTRIPVASFHHEGHRIWGATAGMIVALRELLDIA